MSNAGQAILTIGGAAIGFAFGGIPGAQLGYLIGSGAGSLLFPTQLPTVRGPTLDNLQVQVSTIGNPIPKLWGRFGIGGNVLWSSGLIPTTTKKSVGGKGAPEQTVESTTYSVDAAVAGPEGVVGGLRRLWADAICIYDKRPIQPGELGVDFDARLAATAQIDEILAVYLGTEDQMPDPTIESYLGVGDTLAYRGVAYYVLTGLQLERFGNRLPNLVAEWYTVGTDSEEDCGQYSNGYLYPWQFFYVPGTNDPRNPQNGTHLYADGWGGLTFPEYSFETAMAAMDAPLPDGCHFVCSEQPQGVDTEYLRGWARSTTPNFSNPCDMDDPSAPSFADTAYLTMNMQCLREDPESCEELGGCYAKDFLWHNNDGDLSGFRYANLDGTGQPPYNTNWDNRGDCTLGGETLQMWAAFDQELIVRRWHEPDPGCLFAYPLPGAPGFCIANGVVTRQRSWSRVEGVFKQIRQYDDDGVFTLVESYPRGPVLRSDHEDYNNQAFWEAAYAAAVAENELYPTLGDPNQIPEDWVYGVDYPFAGFSHVSNMSANYMVWQMDCTGESVETPCVAVAEIVADILRRAGLTDAQFDVTDITACVEGYVITSAMSAREMIGPLMTYGLFEAVESQGVLKFVTRGHPHVATLTEDDLAAHGSGGQRPTVVEVRRQLEDQLPQTLRLKYASPERDYEQGEQKASRATVVSTNDVTIVLPIAMSDEAAAQLVEILLYNQWIGRTTYSAITTRARLALEPTDNVLLPVDGYLERMRITGATYATGGLYQLALVRDDDGSYTSTAVPETPARSGNPGGGAGGTVICPAEGILLDLPGLRTGDTDAGYYFVARSLCDNWICAELYRSPDGGETFTWVGKADNEGTIGTVTAADLDGASPDTLEIELESGGPLENATAAQLDTGLNLCAVGADGRWLIGQYHTATLDSGNVWILQMARVGLFGTGAHLADVAAGDRFVLLADAALVRINENPASIGVEKTFKVVACGESIDTAAAFEFTTQGLSYVIPPQPPSVIDDDLSTPPATPSNGDCYLIPDDTGATGAWEGHEGEICCWSDVAGAWQCAPPIPGVPIYVDEDDDYVTPNPSGGITPGGPWTPAIPPLPEESGGAFDPDATYAVVHDGAAYFKLTLAELLEAGTVPAAGNYLISGGGVAWTGGLDYTVSAAEYVIAGVAYSSPETDITLTAADPTDPRIDLIVVDDTGAVVVIAGTPSATPERPDVDPTAQLELSFVYVPATATEPGVEVVAVYYENTEWTTSRSHTTWTLASTSNPYAGTVDVEGTAVASNQWVQFQSPSTLDPNDYDSLVFRIRSKATWGANRTLSLTLRNNTTQRGTAVALKHGTYGFDSSNVTTYQQIVIPVTAFAAGGLTVNQLRMTVTGSGANLGLYLDNIELQTGVTLVDTGDRMRWRGVYNPATAYSKNDVVLHDDCIQYVALAPGAGFPPDTSPAYWQASTCAGGAGGGSGSGGGMTLVAEGEVVGSPATTLPVTGLDLNTDELYFIEIEIIGVSGAPTLAMTYNADTTATNYDVQVHESAATSNAAARANNAVLLTTVTTDTSSIHGWLTINAEARPRFQYLYASGDAASVKSGKGVHTWRTASTNVTGLTLTAGVSNSLGVGSRARVFRLGGAGSGGACCDAADTPFIPVTPLAATNVQDAIEELLALVESDSGGGSTIQFQDEGVNLATPSTVDTLNFVGAGVTATETGGVVTVTIPGTPGGGSLEYVGQQSVTTQQTLTLTGLNLDVDDAYFVSIEIDNVSGSTASVSAYYNADTTATNYDTQVGVDAGAAHTAARANNAVIITAVAGAPISVTGWIRRNVEGCPKFVGIMGRSSTTAIDVLQFHHAWRTSGTNVTQFVLSSSVAASLTGVVKIWKLSDTSGGAGAGTGVLEFRDEGVSLGAPEDVEAINFVGAGVTATLDSSGVVTVNIPGAVEAEDGVGGMAYVNGAEVVGVAANAITVMGLDLDADELYAVVFRVRNNTSVVQSYYLTYNSDVTVTNYFRDLQGGGAGTQANDPTISSTFATANNETVVRGTISRPFARVTSEWTGGPGGNAAASMRSQQSLHQWTTLGANVTQFTIWTASGTAAMDVGSRVDVWKLTTGVGSGSGGGITWQDEGVGVGTVDTVNFVGEGVSAVQAAGTLTVTVRGGIPQIVEAGNRTILQADNGQHVLHAAGAGAGDTYTWDLDLLTAGHTVTVFNLDSNSLALAFTNGTGRWIGSGAGVTGNRTLAPYGHATFVVTATADEVVFDGALIT